MKDDIVEDELYLDTTKTQLEKDIEKSKVKISDMAQQMKQEENKFNLMQNQIEMLVEAVTELKGSQNLTIQKDNAVLDVDKDRIVYTKYNLKNKNREF